MKSRTRVQNLNQTIKKPQQPWSETLTFKVSVWMTGVLECSVIKRIEGITRRRNISFTLDTVTLTFYRELQSVWQTLQSEDLTSLKSERGYTTLKEIIFPSESAQDERNLRASKKNWRMPGWNSPHLTFSMSLTAELTSLE